MEILAVKNLSFTYPLSDTPAIENISFSISKGDFIAVAGLSASGKSTLLRLLMPQLSLMGDLSGEISYTDDIKIGFVMQHPETQIVTDTVYHELAFALENMNMPHSLIERRTAEISAYFGIEDWYDKRVYSLSGGQKQLLNLASAVAMNPDLLILDEPTSRLDPISASDFLNTLKRINRELGITVIIAEHRLDDVLPISDKLMILDNGRLSLFDDVKSAIYKITEKNHAFCEMPTAVKIFHKTNGSDECPVDIAECRKYILSCFDSNIKQLSRAKYRHSDKKAIELKDVYFRYDKSSADVLSGLNLTVYEQEIFCIVGSNGGGKSTALSVMAGLNKQYSGKIKVFDKRIEYYKNGGLYRNNLAYLPQDVQTVFTKNSVFEELESVGFTADLLPIDISHLYNKHPYDLSGGEQQIVAIAKIICSRPKLLLLDEPTKAVDEKSKQRIIEMLKSMKNRGISIIIVTHDLDFASLVADRVALFFNGKSVAEDTVDEFFKDNCFYTTSANRITKGIFENAITVDDAVELCNINTRGGNI